MVVTNVPGNTNVSISRLSVANPDFDAGEYYRIIPAAKSTSGRVDSTTPAICTTSVLCTINDDFRNAGIKVGDTIENTSSTPDAAFGEITAVTATTVTAILYGGTQNFFNAGNNYTIYHDYVHSRKHEIHTRFSGNIKPHDLSATGIRKRDVCLGYNSTPPYCSTLSTPASFSANGGVSLLTVHDFEIDGTTEVGRATFVPSAASTGSLRVANIEYYLAESAGDIPPWFLKNKWHQLVYVSYSGGLAPGGTNCTPGTDCLTLSVDRPWGTETNNDIEALLIMNAGGQLATQDRSAASMAGYFENANAINDLSFLRSNITNAFNDQISLTVP